jgi:hypothetical protein
VNYDAARNNSYVQKVKAFLRDVKNKLLVGRANADLVQKALTPGSVHYDTTLSNISIQYANADYIGTQLMPVVQVAHLSDRYFVYDKRSRLAYPDDALGARASANELNENITTDNFSCKPYGYKEYVDNLTLKNQSAPLDEMVDVIANLNEAIAFREELRIAAILSNSTTFGANTTTLGAPAYWTAAGGSPVTDIQNAAAALWNGRGATRLVGYTSLNVWNALLRSAPILELFKYTRPGLATKTEIAMVLGLDDILVSSARKDTANESQAASYARIWGDVFGIVRVASSPGIRTAGFGYTFRFGQKDTNEWFDPTVGPLGGYYGRVSVVEDHKVVAADVGFLITNPIG